MNERRGDVKTAHEDLTGKTYGNFTVLKMLNESNRYGGKKWVCQCVCGTLVKKTTSVLKIQNTTHCGCVNRGSDRIIGTRFGELTVGEQIQINDPGNPVYCCSCRCGKIIDVQYRQLLYANVISCGCVPNDCKWIGYGGISGSSWYKILCNANLREFELDITIEYVWNLYVQQKGLCIYTGMPITLVRPVGEHSRRTNADMASLDRIDSSIGYLKGNVQWVHKDINRMKQIFTHSQFVKYCQLVAQNHPLENN